jgi:GntR family transcriptional regulator
MMTDWQEHEPIYRQLAALVIEQIISGSLAEGAAVPSVRQVAATERINPLTVSRAYQTLVDDGLLEKRRGIGMFVAPGARAQALKGERSRFLTQEWPQISARITLLDLDLEALLSGEPQ